MLRMSRTTNKSKCVACVQGLCSSGYRDLKLQSAASYHLPGVEVCFLVE